MKRCIIALILALILMISLIGCDRILPYDAYEEIYKRYNEMESFYAAAVVTVFSDKGESEYSVRQFYEAPDKFAFFVDAPQNVAGSGYVSKDGQFVLKSGTGDSFSEEVAFPDSKNCMFICDFFEEYYKNEETMVTVDNDFWEDKLVMECYTSDRNPNRFMMRLTVDTKTYLPLELVTYNAEKKPVIKVKFYDFKRNSDIDEKIFN